MIKIHGLSGELETIKYIGNLGALIDQYNPQWRYKQEWEGELYVNGNLVLPADFDSVVISELCTVDIYIRPHGGVFKAVGKLLGGVINLAFGFLMPRSRSSNHNRVNTPQGERLEASEIKANQARLGSVVPEAFGKYRVYMDYLSEPRRYFKDRRQQEIEALLCVGVGDYVTEQVKIGDTDIGDMENSEHTFYPPNNDVGRYAELWHTVDEVGATSSGTAGLELSMDLLSLSEMQNIPPQGGYTFTGLNGRTITRNDGSFFNSNWQQGVEVGIGDIVDYENYLDGDRLRIRGDFSFIENNEELLPYFGDIYIAVYLGSIPQRRKATPKFLSRSAGVDIVYYEVNIGSIYPNIVQLTIGMYPNFDIGNFTLVNGRIAEIIENNGSNIIVELEDGSDLSILPPDTGIQYFSGGRNVPSFTNTYAATPVGIKTDLLELDFFFPQGLCYINDDGGLGWQSVTINVQIVNKEGAVIHDSDITYRENTNDQIGFTHQIPITLQGGLSARVRRKTAASNSVQSHSQVTWYGLKSRLPSRNKYPSWTTMGVRIQSGGKLSAQSENTINAVVTRKLPVLQESGEWSAPQATRDIASAIKYITDRIGYTDQEIDMHELLHLHNTKWKPRNETFDYVFDEVTVKQAIDNVLNAGMSDMTIANGKIKPVRDDIRTIIEQSYSAQNTISQISKTFRAKKINDFDGVEVGYIDAEQGYEKKVIVCKLPQSDGFKLRKVSIKGVTDRKRAWQIGMRLASEDRYVNKDYSIKTEMDALNSEYGSFIGIIEEIPELSQSCLILQVNDDHVVVSEPPLGNASIFSWRDEYGKLQGPFNIDRVEDNRIYVQLNKKPTVTLNQELPHAYIGTSTKMTRTALVDDISPNGTNNATIRASNYDERVYAYDNSEVIE